MSVTRTPGTVLLLGKRVPAERCDVMVKHGVTGYTVITRKTFTGRTVTCGPKIEATFQPNADVHSNDLATSYDMVLKRDELVKRFQRLRDMIEYRDDYHFVVRVTPGMKYPYLQLKHYRPDTYTGDMAEGGSGKAYLSEFMSDSEFFQCALGLAIAYEQHEVREFFRVQGDRPYHPHIAWHALAEVSYITDARQQEDLNGRS